MHNKKVKIILVQIHKVDRDNGASFYEYRIAKLIGAVTVNTFSYRDSNFRVGDRITEDAATALASVREFEVTVTEQPYAIS